MEGRNDNFQQGTVTAQDGMWAKTGNGVGQNVGSVAPNPVRPHSVLQPFTSSGSGYAEPDRQRKLLGQGSVNGQSQMTSQLTTQRKYPFIQI